MFSICRLMIFFRVDGNTYIGMGHIMRCLSIANTAKDFGETCRFILSSDECRDIIAINGHEVDVLNTDYSRPEPGDILSYLDIYDTSAVIVDSYYVSVDYLRTVHTACKTKECKLVYVDDRCFAPYPCDILLNYNIFGKIEDYKKLYDGEVEPIYLLGASYAPLRKEFQDGGEREGSCKARNIFVSTGGSDAEHLTLDLLEEAVRIPDYIFHFVVGMMNPDREEIKEKAQNRRNIVIHENVMRMDELMRSCDVGISAAGSTLYELCAMRTPTITYVIADNQIPAAKEFSSRGIMKNCGDIREFGGKNLAKRLIGMVMDLSDDFDERKRIAELMGSIVDGKGAKRILEQVLIET